MVKLVSIKADLENVEELDIDTTVFWFRVQCTSCREVQKNDIAVDSQESHEMPGSRGSANLVAKCDFCKNGFSISYESSFKRKPYSAEAAEAQQFGPIAQFECRGCDLSEWLPLKSEWRAKGPTATFEQIELEDWTDYDEGAREPVSISSVQAKVSRS